MNRRDLLKALAGLPLLGLLPQLPPDPTIDLASFQKALAGISAAAKAVIPCLRGLADSVQQVKFWIRSAGGLWVLCPETVGAKPTPRQFSNARRFLDSFGISADRVATRIKQLEIMNS